MHALTAGKQVFLAPVPLSELYPALIAKKEEEGKIALAQIGAMELTGRVRQNCATVFT